METRHLQVFTAVYRTRSFTRAAEELFTSQPTISEHMKNLEDRLNCKLFDRLGRSISPTPEADLLYPRAIAILDEMEKLETTIASTTQTVSGELIIGAGTIPGAYVLPQLAALFQKQYRDVSFEILINDSADIIEKIARHELYIGVVGAAQPSSTKVEFVPFSGDELVLAVRDDSSIPETIDARQLIQLDFIKRTEGSGTGKNVAQFLESIGLSLSMLKIRATLGSSTAVKEAVKSGLGAAIISKIAIRDELESGRLKTVRVNGLNMRRSFYIAISKKRTLPHHYQVFADFLMQQQG